MEKPERLSLQSADGAQLNLDALYQIAPSCFTEATDPKTGKIKRVVNFDVLRQLLGDDTVEDATEAYEFNWVGKQEARAEVLRPINKTLRPVKEDSVDWDNTQNLYIEGDNLEVLKLLQKSYLGKVKMIYIDPPYNTGNDFVYHDDFARTQAEEDKASGAVDELGNRYWKNTDSNGKYHSDWCSMIYSRLMVARSLLTEDGVIFISIGDDEEANLIKICDEIFGGQNVISLIPRIAKKGSDQGTFFRPTKDYILSYAKNIDNLDGFIDKNIGTEKKNYPFKENGRNYRKAHSLFQASLDPLRGCINQRYYIEAPDGTLIIPPGDNFPIDSVDGGQIAPQTKNDKVWRWSKDSYLAKKDIIMFDKSQRSPLVDSNGNHTDWNVYEKKYEDEESKEIKDPLPNDVIYDFINTLGTTTLHNLGLDFSFSKPHQLIKYLLEIINKENDILILDFFSGSATTAHAVMELNAEDNGKRKYILVQVNEKLPQGTSDFSTIPELAKERIRRAGKKIKEESPLTTQDLDTGFRVFRVDESNFEDVEKTPKEYKQDELDLFLNNVKSDRNDLDLLFGCMLDWGVKLSLPMASEEVDGKMIYTVNDGDLVACFAEKVTDKVVKTMAEKQPLRVIFRDSCFEQDADKINIYETFKQLLYWSDENVKNNIRVI